MLLDDHSRAAALNLAEGCPAPKPEHGSGARGSLTPAEVEEVQKYLGAAKAEFMVVPFQSVWVLRGDAEPVLPHLCSVSEGGGPPRTPKCPKEREGVRGPAWKFEYIYIYVYVCLCI